MRDREEEIGRKGVTPTNKEREREREQEKAREGGRERKGGR